MIDDVLDQRRKVLSPRLAVATRLSYIVEMNAALPHDEAALVTLHFVPDRFSLDAESFVRYVSQLDLTTRDAEALALTILEDVVNELVCRWVRVKLTWGDKTVIAEDHQPGWSNDILLANIR